MGFGLRRALTELSSASAIDKWNGVMNKEMIFFVFFRRTERGNWYLVKIYSDLFDIKSRYRSRRLLIISSHNLLFANNEPE